MTPDRLRAARALLRAALRARRSPDEFAAFCFRDPAGRALRQADVHRELQAFLGRHARALVELPRDHGKTFQVCLRVLWELGRDPALRVKVVCATAALAEERGRFLRDAVAANARLRLVFPKLVPAAPWGATRFTVGRPADVIGPSVTALGVGAASTGTRADLLVCDDIVDRIFSNYTVEPSSERQPGPSPTRNPGRSAAEVKSDRDQRRSGGLPCGSGYPALR